MVKLPPEIELMDKEEQEDYIRRMKLLEAKKKKIIVKRPIRPPEWESMSKIEQRDYKRFMKEKEERGFKITWKEHLAAIGRSIKIAESTKGNAARIAAKVKKQLEETAALPKKVFSTPKMREEAKAKTIVKAKASIAPVVNIIKEKVSVVIPPAVKEKVSVVIPRNTFPLKAAIVGMVGIGAAALYYMRRKKR